jgi:diaminohydroxyphosphoribosylaminopyrimidine deaminase/5-amino-6-(5-phosphoribosylamino)uracil reductase
MHEQFMLAALEQAKLGRGLCAPNPSVGAVAVHAGQIIARAWHRGAGTPHAEQLLLSELPKTITDITLYVTLEPCNHWGKTPPCVEAIIQRGIKQVVYAYRDPNPTVAMNNTPRLLGECGIEVLHYPLPVIDEFYQSYRHWTLTKKPWVTVKMAQTLDGKISGLNGERIAISNACCAVFTHQQRLYSDVILTTARTVNQDNPLLNARLENREVAKSIALIDVHGTVNPEATLFKTAKHCHIYTASQSLPKEGYANRTYHVLPSKHGLLHLDLLLQHLGELGYHDVWVEAGARLFNALHAARLVNRTYLYVAPTIIGDRAVSLYHHEPIFNQANKVTWRAMGDNVMAVLDWMDV